MFERFSSYDMKAVIGDLNAKVEMEEILRPTIRKESLRGLRMLNFATLRDLTITSIHLMKRYSKAYVGVS